MIKKKFKERKEEDFHTHAAAQRKSACELNIPPTRRHNILAEEPGCWTSAAQTWLSKSARWFELYCVFPRLMQASKEMESWAIW